MNQAISYVKETRRYGSTYIHAEIRKAHNGFEGIKVKLSNGREAVVTWAGYGRSLQGGGHKYKAHAHYADDNKIVRSKDLIAV